MTSSGTYISELVVPEMWLVAFKQLNGQITVLPVTLLQTHSLQQHWNKFFYFISQQTEAQTQNYVCSVMCWIKHYTTPPMSLGWSFSLTCCLGEREVVAMVTTQPGNDLQFHSKGNLPLFSVCLAQKHVSWLNCTDPASLSLMKQTFFIMSDVLLIKIINPLNWRSFSLDRWTGEAVMLCLHWSLLC